MCLTSITSEQNSPKYVSRAPGTKEHLLRLYFLLFVVRGYHKCQTGSQALSTEHVDGPFHETKIKNNATAVATRRKVTSDINAARGASLERD